MQDKAYTFGGRLRPKQPESDFHDLSALPHQRMAFVYQRLSSYEQVRKSVYSLQMQDALVDLAKEDGYPNDLIYVEKRDLGISGTLGQEKREGLAYLIRLIEDDKIESVYTVHASRLYRDQTLIDGFTFAELCREHNVILVMPNMRLNLRDKMHMRMFRIELERAADELELMRVRLFATRDFKASQGFYAGGPIPVGYVLDLDKDSKTYQKIKPYPPHAEVVRKIFQKAYENDASGRAAARILHIDGVRIPLFEGEAAEIMMGEKKRSSLRLCKPDSDGYIITPKLVRNVITNPVYIGWWIWRGEILSTENHEPIVDEDIFWAIQEIINSRPKVRRRRKNTTAILSGLLWCNNHDGELMRVKTMSKGKRSRWENYGCGLEYVRGVSDHFCFCVATALLDVPITEFVISQCSYSEYASEVLEYLENQHKEAEDRVKANRREYQRLTREIDNLKHNLALTKTEKQVEMILEEIDRRMEERKELTEMASQPIGKPLTEAEVETVRELLGNLPKLWEQLTNETKNEFLRIVLDKIILTHDRELVRAKIIWNTGFEQEIVIKRPLVNYNQEKAWTDEEIAILREHYPTSPKERLRELLPKRTETAVYQKAKQLKIKRKVKWTRNDSKQRRWTEEEDRLLKACYDGEISFEELMEKTGRSYSSITSRVYRHKDYRMDPKLKRKFGALDPEKIEWEVLDDGRGQLTSEGTSTAERAYAPSPG